MKTRTRSIGRDARTGRWIPTAEARRRKNTAIVQRYQVKVTTRKK